MLLRHAGAKERDALKDAVGGARQRLRRYSALRCVTGDAMLVHGQAVPHACGAAHQQLQQEAVTAAVQPAHSPDMVRQGYGRPGATRALLDRVLPM